MIGNSLASDNREELPSDKRKGRNATKRITRKKIDMPNKRKSSYRRHQEDQVLL